MAERPKPFHFRPETRRVATMTLLVRDYDEAIAWYRTRLGFLVYEDSDLGEGRRWVVVCGNQPGGARLLLAKAKNAAEDARIGDQTGGRVMMFVETDDIDRDHARMSERGVVFRETPRRERYGTVAVFEDLYGNLIDLIEPR